MQYKIWCLNTMRDEHDVDILEPSRRHTLSTNMQMHKIPSSTYYHTFLKYKLTHVFCIKSKFIKILWYIKIKFYFNKCKCNINNISF